MTDFETWWHKEGSGMPPLAGEDAEAHVRRVCEIAWANGAFKAKVGIEDDSQTHSCRICGGTKTIYKMPDDILVPCWLCSAPANYAHQNPKTVDKR